MKRHRSYKTRKNRKEEQNNFFLEKQNKTKKNTGNDGFFQAKLEIGDPSSPFEQEADAMADHVLQQDREAGSGAAFGEQAIQRQAEEEEPATKRIQRQAEEEEPATKRIQRQAEEEEPAAKRIQRQAEEEEPAAKRIQRQAEEEEPAAKRIQRQAEEEEPAAKRIQRQAEEEEPATKRIQRQAEEEEPAAKTLQRKSDSKSESTGAKTTMESVEAMIQKTKGQGMPLPEEVKSELESKMQADFSQVRIHTDAKAIELSALLKAQAFTHGYDIYFNSGKYDPYSSDGKHLLVHELTHVVQQKG